MFLTKVIASFPRTGDYFFACMIKAINKEVMIPSIVKTKDSLQHTIKSLWKLAKIHDDKLMIKNKSMVWRFAAPYVIMCPLHFDNWIELHFYNCMHFISHLAPVPVEANDRLTRKRVIENSADALSCLPCAHIPANMWVTAKQIRYNGNFIRT